MTSERDLGCVERLCSEARYGGHLAPYLADSSNLFVVSSDFCHWGSRFQYTFFDEHQVTIAYS